MHSVPRPRRRASETLDLASTQAAAVTELTRRQQSQPLQPIPLAQMTDRHLQEIANPSPEPETPEECRAVLAKLQAAQLAFVRFAVEWSKAVDGLPTAAGVDPMAAVKVHEAADQIDGALQSMVRCTLSAVVMAEER